MAILKFSLRLASQFNYQAMNKRILITVNSPITDPEQALPFGFLDAIVTANSETQSSNYWREQVAELLRQTKWCDSKKKENWIDNFIYNNDVFKLNSVASPEEISRINNCGEAHRIRFKPAFFEIMTLNDEKQNEKLRKISNNEPGLEVEITDQEEAELFEKVWYYSKISLAVHCELSIRKTVISGTLCTEINAPFVKTVKTIDDYDIYVKILEAKFNLSKSQGIIPKFCSVEKFSPLFKILIEPIKEKDYLKEYFGDSRVIHPEMFFICEDLFKMQLTEYWKEPETKWISKV